MIPLGGGNRLLDSPTEFDRIYTSGPTLWMATIWSGIPPNPAVFRGHEGLPLN